MNERKNFKIALVGCGRISRSHIEAISAVDGLSISAVCDQVLDRASAAGRALGVPFFTSYAQMLVEAECHAVAIATPSGLHPEHGIAAAQAGKHVISEKPIGISLESADALIGACDSAGVRLFVVKQNRLNPAIQLLKKAIDKGRFGRLFTVTSTVRWSRPQEYYDQAAWRGTWALDGGALLNQASHYVDLMQWLVGPVESIVAKTATLARRIEAEDTAMAVLKFCNGALGVVDVTVLTFPKNLEGSIVILGESGAVKVGGTAVNRVEHWAFADYDDDDKLVDQATTSSPGVYGFGHVGYYRNVLAVLRGEAAPDTDGREGRKSLEVVLGIYQAARTNRCVTLPLTL